MTAPVDLDKLEELARAASTCTCEHGTIGGGVSLPTTSIKRCRVHGPDGPGDDEMGYSIGEDVLKLIAELRGARSELAAKAEQLRLWDREVHETHKRVAALEASVALFNQLLDVWDRDYAAWSASPAEASDRRYNAFVEAYEASPLYRARAEQRRLGYDKRG